MLTVAPGNLITLAAEFTHNGEPVDPSVVTCVTIDPNGKHTTVVVTRTGQGTYQAETEPSTHGKWEYRFVGTGSAIAAEEGTFFVRASEFT